MIYHPPEEFASKVSGIDGLTEQECVHACLMYEEMGSEMFKDYHEAYLISDGDVLLLAICLEAYRREVWSTKA